ncbi:hypothetical protein ABKV19_022694 [Rosa sericea]
MIMRLVQLLMLIILVLALATSKKTGLRRIFYEAPQTFKTTKASMVAVHQHIWRSRFLFPGILSNRASENPESRFDIVMVHLLLETVKIRLRIKDNVNC